MLVPPSAAGSPFCTGLALAEDKAPARGGQGLPWVSAGSGPAAELGTQML